MTEQLVGKQRVSAAFKRTFTDQNPALDRIPAYIFSGSCNAKLVGASIRQFLQDPKVFARAQIAAYERYRPDIMIMMWDLSIDIEAMGCELRYPEDGMSVVTEAFLGDGREKLDSLRVPDPHKDGRLPAYLEACAEAKKAISDAPVSAVIAGPWTIAMGLRGATKLIIDAKKDPDFVHQLMRICTQATQVSTEALAQIGVGIGYSEAPASCDLISPSMYREFVLPYHTELISHFNGKKIGVGLHVCGNANPILEELASTGASNVSVDSGTALEKAAEVFNRKAVLIGNVPTDCFLADSKEVMKRAVQECLAKAPKNSGYILAPGCEVPTVADPSKISWFMDLAREVGTYQ
jgi:uroporphyrinogen decarboxylase